MEIDALFSDELYSRERLLRKELADIRQQIEQRRAESCKGNLGKCFKFESDSENDIECYKLLDYISNFNYYAVIVYVGKNNASINMENNIYLNDNIIEITEEEFNEQYHKALEIIERNLHNG